MIRGTIPFFLDWLGRRDAKVGGTVKYPKIGVVRIGFSSETVKASYNSTYKAVVRWTILDFFDYRWWLWSIVGDICIHIVLHTSCLRKDTWQCYSSLIKFKFNVRMR